MRAPEKKTIKRDDAFKLKIALINKIKIIIEKIKYNNNNNKRSWQ